MLIYLLFKNACTISESGIGVNIELYKHAYLSRLPYTCRGLSQLCWPSKHIFCFYICGPGQVTVNYIVFQFQESSVSKIILESNPTRSDAPDIALC